MKGVPRTWKKPISTERLSSYVDAINHGWEHVVKMVRGRPTLIITQKGRIK